MNSRARRAAGSRGRAARGRHPRPKLASAWPLVVLVVAVCGCDESALENVRADAGPIPGGLTPEQAAGVLARVGDSTITLGDFAATLERMNSYDRLRFQTEQRRRDLLDEMIANELLAQEARRQGLHHDPEVQQRIRQVLREAMVAHAAETVPKPPNIPEAEVREYYQSHRDEFREPERRQVAAIIMTDRAQAERVLRQALQTNDGEAWGKLFHEHSVTAPEKRDPTAPLDLAGKLGLVGPTDDPKGSHEKVPEAVRRAVFELANVGEVYDQLVPVEDKYYIIRMTRRVAGHTRSLAEADRSIRVTLFQQKVAARRQQVEQQLRKRFPVQIDEGALSAVKLPFEPGAPSSGDSSAGTSAAPGPGGPGADAGR